MASQGQLIMPDDSSEIKGESKLPRWTRLTLSAMVPIGMMFVSIILFFFFFFGLHEAFTEAKLIHTDTCGHYQLRAYKFEGGNGYLQLVDDKNKVLDELSFHEATPWGPFDWEKDCRVVTVGGDEGRTDMKVDR